MPDQAKNVAIGLFVVAACAIIIFIILFLHPKTGDEGHVYNIRFADVDKINVGSRVTFAGRPVGEVKEILEIPNSREGYVDEDGNVYPFELTIVVDSGIQLFETDKVMLKTSGLLGERSVTIIPEPIKKGEKPKLITKNQIFYSSTPGSIEDTLSEIKKLSKKFTSTLDEIVYVFQKMKKNQFWDNLGVASENLKEISTALNQPEKLSSIIEHFEDFSRHADKFGERLLRSWDTVDKALTHFEETTSNTSLIVTQIKSGEGTVGKAIYSDDLYLRLVSVLNKIETIGDDVNHYGLLFQNDKGWQRLRARRMNMLAKLSSPQEFRNYFNDEIDQISTSLSRVSMVLEKTEDACYPYNLIENREFAKVFSELLRRISGIEEELRMYNGQLMETEVQKTELDPCVNRAYAQ